MSVNETVGDAAAMREVVMALAAVILPPRDKAGEGGWLAWVRAMQEKARAALATPPRNCDVYDNESCRMAYHLHGDGIMTMQAFADWLFAPATEQKGDNDGK